MKKTKPKRKSNAGRPELGERKRKARSVCWLRDDQKERLQAAAKRMKRSESDLLLRGLVAIGVLPNCD